MLRRSLLCFLLGCLLFLAAPLPFGWANPPREKVVWNYDGGVQLVTDGTVPDGPCFRLTGRLTSENFFTNLRRVDVNGGTLYRRGNDVVTEFPDKLRLSFVVYDFPCGRGLQAAGTRVYLTTALISKFRIRFSWKHGMDMRPAHEIVMNRVERRPIPEFPGERADGMPELYEWWFDFDVPSKGVPLTDSLVLVILSPDGRIIARVAARM
jgi:hypothetical protein